MRIFNDNFKVYGSRKIYRQMRNEGIVIGRHRVRRLMAELDIAGLNKSRKKVTTTKSNKAMKYPKDMVKRNFKATRPNQLWVSDITYVRVKSGFCYSAFITDVYANYIVGWMVSDKCDKKLVIDALDMAIAKRNTKGEVLIHHSDRGVQYFSNDYVQRLKKELIAQSVGSTGDSYDNALSESVNSFYKGELIYNRYLNKVYSDKTELELATSSYVHWWNNIRIQERLGYLSPAAYENQNTKEGDAA